MHHTVRALADAVCMRGSDLLGTWRTAAQGLHHPGLGTPAGVEAYPPFCLPCSSMTAEELVQQQIRPCSDSGWQCNACLSGQLLEAAEALFNAATFTRICCSGQGTVNSGHCACVQCFGNRREARGGRWQYTTAARLSTSTLVLPLLPRSCSMLWVLPVPPR